MSRHKPFTDAQLIALAEMFYRFERHARAASMASPISAEAHEAMLAVAGVAEDIGIELTAQAARVDK